MKDARPHFSEMTADQIRELILEKALNRFFRYGFGKTTMVEIARDCDMSAGNLYRYFDSKFEIGVQVARMYICRAETLLREIVRRPGLSPTKKLEAFVIEKLKFMYQNIVEQPNVQDLVDYILENRWDLVEQHREVQNSLMAEILAEGNRTGEFNVPDIVKGAQAVYVMTTMFRLPHSIRHESLEQLLKEARSTLEYMINGLSGRG